MPAGVVPLNLPDPGVGAGLAELKKLKREIAAIRAVERAAGRAARRAAQTQRFANALAGGFKAGIGGRSLAGLMAGSPHVIAVKVAAAILGRAAGAFMGQSDIPEIARLGTTLERTAGAAARALFGAGVAPLAIFKGLADDMAGALRGSIDHVTVRLELISMGVVRKMAGTAGLERGGTRVDGRFQRGFAEGGAIFTLPGSATFTEPQNVIVEDFKGVTEEEEAAAFLRLLGEREDRRRREREVAAAESVMGHATAVARDAIDDSTKAAARKLARLDTKATERGTALPGILEIPTDATESLNEALELDAELLGTLAGSSDHAARTQRAIRMAIIGGTAVFRGAVALAKGIAEAIAQDWFAASAHFTAAGLYASAAALAGVGGLSGRGDRDNDQRRASLARETELVIVVPGVSDTRRLKEEIVRAINADAPAHGREERASPRLKKPSTAEIVQGLLDGQTAYGRNGTVRQRVRRHLERDVILGPVLKVGKKAEREVSRTGKRVRKEIKRARKRLGL